MTTAYNFPVIRWPVEVASGANGIGFSDTADASPDTRTFTVQTWMLDGDGGVTPFTDLVDAFNTEVQVAMDNVHGAGGTTTITLNASGFLQLSHDGAKPDLRIQIPNAATTFDLTRLGFDTGLGDFDITSSIQTLPCQVEGAWYPGIDPERDSGDQDRTLWRENQSLSGRVSRVKHTDKVWFDRFMRFDFIPSARVFQARLDVTAYATVAGLAALDPNAAFVNVREYLLDGSTPQPGVVYVYDTSDPLTAVHSGPYQVITEDVWDMETGGITDESLVQTMSSEHYRIKIHLRREAV